MTQPGISRKPLLAALALALLTAAAPGEAQEPAQEREHEVKRGDTLWDLAGQYLANPFLWPMIYEANRSVVEDPHWIYPGERLRIPGVPGEAAAQVLGEPVAQPAAAAPGVTTEPAKAAAGAAVTLDLRRPFMAAGEYRATPWLESSWDQRFAGRILRLPDRPSTAADKISAAIHPHERILIGELQNPSLAVGDSVLVVRLGRELIGYGQVVEPLALARVDSLGEKVLIARLLVQFNDARLGDAVVRLDPLPEFPVGRPQPVADGPTGRLLEFLVDRQLHGTGDHAFVIMDGEQLGLGDEVAIYVAGERLETAGGEVVPPTAVARARVVRLSGRSATVRLVGVFDTSVRDGLPVRLVGRMP